MSVVCLALFPMLMSVVLELLLGGATALLVREYACLMVGCQFHLPVLEVGAGPLLMEQLVDALCPFLALDILNEGEHARFLVVFGEDLADQGVHVEASERNELPAVPHGGQVRDKVLDVVLTHVLGVPVEARREVVGEEHVGLEGMDAVCEVLRH